MRYLCLYPEGVVSHSPGSRSAPWDRGVMLTTLRISACLALLAVGGVGTADEPPKPPQHRAFQPVVRPKVPEVKGKVRTEVDRFILAALEAKQLSLNPEADRATLIRRVAFDLTGLPPTVPENEQ